MNDLSINGNNFVVYYDEQDNEQDGYGWNFVLVPGSTALRFQNLTGLVDYLAQDSEWLTKHLSTDSTLI